MVQAPPPDGTSGQIRGRGFGHGKVILIGEHAVVYGQPAVAAGLSMGVAAEVTGGTGRLTAPAWNMEARAGDDSAPGRALAAILGRLEVNDVDVRLEGNLPPRVGLGSSAAVAVAVSRAVAQAAGRDAAAAHAAANAAEVVFHGTPSGIDLAAAASGAVGRFQREGGWSPIAVLQAMTLCVGLSGRGHDTRAQVDSVRRLRERTPAVATVMTAMGELAVAAEVALAQGDIDGLGRVFDVAHGLLAALRVSSPELDALVHGARAAGAVGAKLTGAGGGGAVIALAPGHERDVLRRWRDAGFEGFLAQIGPGHTAAMTATATATTTTGAAKTTAKATPR